MPTAPTINNVAATNAVFGTSDHPPQFNVLAASPAQGFYFAGSLGQFLYVDPAKRLVAVRMRRPTEADYANPAVEVDGFPAFPADVYRLVP